MHICVDVGSNRRLRTICRGRIPTTPRDATGKCYDLDPDTGIGTCIEMCVGPPENPRCPHHGYDCSTAISGSGLALCFPGCSPLDAGSCPLGETCVAAYQGDSISDFICWPAYAEGITGESCECANCCADGHMCTDAATYGPGCVYDLCCTEYCDITDAAFTCAGPDQQCVALFDPADPVYANVGACMVP